MGIGRRLGAREHEWRSGKLVEEQAGAMGGRRLLPTATITSPERRSGRWKQLELGVLVAGGLAVQLERAQATGVAKQKGEGDKASTRVFAAAARWRPAGARGDRGTCKAGQQGRARAASKVGVTRGERRQQEMNSGDGGRAAARGRALRRWQKGKQRSRGGSEEEEETDQARRTSLEFSESSRASQ
jgi:hypothetical protein